MDIEESPGIHMLIDEMDEARRNDITEVVNQALRQIQGSKGLVLYNVDGEIIYLTSELEVPNDFITTMTNMLPVVVSSQIPISSNVQKKLVSKEERIVLKDEDENEPSMQLLSFYYPDLNPLCGMYVIASQSGTEGMVRAEMKKLAGQLYNILIDDPQPDP
jgi:hypothetical protein